jgi:restriction endonuclease S subunit
MWASSYLSYLFVIDMSPFFIMFLLKRKKKDKLLKLWACIFPLICGLGGGAGRSGNVLYLTASLHLLWPSSFIAANYKIQMSLSFFFLFRRNIIDSEKKFSKNFGHGNFGLRNTHLDFKIKLITSFIIVMYIIVIKHDI